ncbi:hypothetical protein GGR53DRAFT_415903 [Hypoxylon sp. FL1150]|nr:hypothetical protein GGR53DRAFT_415903 [Hypoxylon sp. FL1150]
MFLWVSLVFMELNRCYPESEIKQSLEHLPHDLDREYYRLFAKLIARLRGTSARPSIFVRRVKCLLTLIIIAGEPLTYDKLRHAFASCQHSEQGYEECLIGPEGIADSIGDFVRVWDGRYHIAHSSLTEFLTRDVNVWKEDDKAIDFFRIDIMEAHSTMCLACLNYLMQADLGYPMTDYSPRNLSTRLVFFQYASSNIPYHLMEHSLVQSSRLLEFRLHEFLRSPQFCAVIEYLFLRVQHGAWALIYDHMQFLEALENSEDLATLKKSLTELIDFNELFEQELYHRKTEFGPDLVKCQSWQSVIMALGWINQNQKNSYPIRDEDITNLRDSRGATEERATQIARSPISDLSRYLSTIQLEGTDLFINSIIKLRFPTSILTLSEEILPIPILIFGASRVPKPAEGIRLVSIALRRLNGQRNFSEAFSSSQMAYLLGTQDDTAETICQLYRKGLDIATKLPPQPHVEFLILHNLYNLLYHLSSQGKYEESNQILLLLKRRLLGGPLGNQCTANTGNQAKRCLRLLHGKSWKGYNALKLSEVAWCLNLNGHYEDARQIADRVIVSFDRFRLKRGVLLSTLAAKANSQYDTEAFYAAEQTYRILLREIERSKEKIQLCRRWLCLSSIAWWLFKQGKESEAVQLIQQIDVVWPWSQCTTQLNGLSEQLLIPLLTLSPWHAFLSI